VRVLPIKHTKNASNGTFGKVCVYMEQRSSQQHWHLWDPPTCTGGSAAVHPALSRRKALCPYRAMSNAA
jgi:hypothetical protein